MSDGVVVVAGVFQPGSVVSLVEVESESVMRPGEIGAIEQRLVDDNGNVGFEGLDVGGRYFVTGYVNGYYVALRAVGTDVSSPDSPLMQAPVGNSPANIGTQNAPEVVVASEPATSEELEVGVPEALQTILNEPVEVVVVPEGEPEPEAAPEPEEPAPEQPVADEPTEPPAPEVPAEPEATPIAPAPADPAPAVPVDPAPVDPLPPEPVAVDPPAPEAVAQPESPVADPPVDPSAPVVEQPPADALPVDPAAAAPGEVTNQLVAQATGLGVPEAASLTDDELRAAITEKGGTPVV